MARILVIDDNALFGSLMKRSLEQRGHAVQLAFDPVTARELIAEFHFDALVSDIVLPGETGLKILRDVRQSNPDMALVAVSGGSSKGRSVHVDVFHMASAVGADEVLRKPFAMSDFVNVVESSLSRRTTRNAANRGLPG